MEDATVGTIGWFIDTVLLRDLRRMVLDCNLHYLGFGVEMQINSALADAGFLGNIVNGGLGIAIMTNEFPRGMKNRLVFVALGILLFVTRIHF